MAAGYGPVKGCAQNPGVGGMGQHYVKGDLVGDRTSTGSGRKPWSTSPARAAATSSWRSSTSSSRTPGTRRSARTRRSLFGKRLSLVTAPNAYELPDFYEIHLWLWKKNPTGPPRRLEPAGVLPRPPVLGPASE